MWWPKEQSLVNRVPLFKRTAWALTVILLLFATSRALPNDKVVLSASAPAGNITDRRMVISIPDKKLALVENGRALKIYPVAVGA